MSDEPQRRWRDLVQSLGPAGAGLEDALEPSWQRGRAAHGLEVDRLRFAERLGEALVHAASRRATLELSSVAVEDLYLVCGALDGDATAVAAVLVRLAPQLDRVLHRLVPPTEHEDTRQRVETHLLVARDDRGPALGSYRASGPLDGWLRAVCMRFVVDDTRARARAPAQAQWQSTADDVVPSEIEAGVALVEHTKDVRDAIERAFSKLEVRQRNLIRYSVFHGLGVDDLGALYSVHRSTAARWLERARSVLSVHVEAELAELLGGSGAEAASLLRAVRSHMDVSIRSFLASTIEAEADAG